MKLYVSLVEEQTEEVLRQLENDYRINFYEGHIFVLEHDAKDIKNEYDIYDLNYTEELLSIFDIDNILDLDLQIIDQVVNLDNENYLLFYNNFNKWVKNLKNEILELKTEVIENQEEHEENYKKMLEDFAKELYKNN